MPQSIIVMAFEFHVPHPPGVENAEYHRKQFLAERIGWGAMALYLAWALIGGFGDGWISEKQASNAAESCSVEYQRFGRRDAPFKLRVSLRLDEPQERFGLHLNRQFLERVKIERVTPDFERMEADPQGATLSFAIEPERGDQLVTIEYKPQHAGTLHAAVRPAQEAEVAFDQFVYP